jgi:hypothetical protein
MDLNKKNKFARNLFRCPKCNKPIAEIRGNEIYLIKYSKGKPIYVKIEVDHDAGGRFKVSCDCGGYFATTVKTLEMTYAVKSKK